MPTLDVKRVGRCRSKRRQAEATCGPWSPSHSTCLSPSPVWHQSPDTRHVPPPGLAQFCLRSERAPPTALGKRQHQTYTLLDVHLFITTWKGRTHLLFMENLDSFLLFCLWPPPPHPSNQTCYPGNKLDRPKILMTNGTEGKQKKLFVFTRCRRKHPINQRREGWTDRSWVSDKVEKNKHACTHTCRHIPVAPVTTPEDTGFHSQAETTPWG